MHESLHCEISYAVHRCRSLPFDHLRGPVGEEPRSDNFRTGGPSGSQLRKKNSSIERRRTWSQMRALVIEHPFSAARGKKCGWQCAVGACCVTGPIQFQAPFFKVCELSRLGADRALACELTPGYTASRATVFLFLSSVPQSLANHVNERANSFSR